MPPISIVVPTYNGERYVADTVRSVFAQTRPPVEILVVDDCSTDGTVAAVRALAASAPVPVRVLSMPRNTGGPAGPINVGIAEARGEWVGVLDQDDWFTPDRLAAAARSVGNEPGVVLAACACRVVAGSGRFELPTRSTPHLTRLAYRGRRVPGGAVVPGPAFLRRLVSAGNFVVGWPGFLFRRDVALRVGGADASLRVASDYDFLCRLASAGDAAVSPRPLYRRREHVGNLSRTSAARCAVEVIRVMRKYGSAAGADGEDFWARVEGQYFWAVNQMGGRGEAARRMAVALREWGPSLAGVTAACRLVAGGVLGALSGRTRPTDPAVRDELRGELECLRRARNARDFTPSGDGPERPPGRGRGAPASRVGSPGST